VVLRASRWLFYVSAAFVPLTAVRSFAGVTIGDAALGLAAALALLSLSRPSGMVHRALIVASALAILALVLIAPSSSSALTELAVAGRMVFVWVVWAWVASVSLLTRRHFAVACSAFVIGACLSSIVALAQLGGLDLRSLVAEPSTGTSGRLAGLGEHANGQGGTLAVGLVLCLGAILAGRLRRWATVAAAIVAIGLLLTASITGLIAACVGLLVLLWRIRSFKTLAAAGALILGAALLFTFLQRAFPGVVTPFSRFESAIGIGGVSTVDQRRLTIEYAWERIAENPLTGIGFADGGGTYNGVTQAHNMEILAWYQGGPILAAAIVIVLGATIAVGLRSKGDYLMATLFAAAVSAIFFAQTGPSLYDRFLWLPVVLLLTAQTLRSTDSQEPAVELGQLHEPRAGQLRPR
jgi:O-antigen ligase